MRHLSDATLPLRASLCARSPVPNRSRCNFRLAGCSILIRRPFAFHVSLVPDGGSWLVLGPMDDRAYKMKHYLSFPQCQKLFWIFPIALLIVFVIRFLDVNSQTLATVEHLASTRGHVIGVAGGDVSLRDVPRACEIARGRFLTDPHYKGEAPWYPAVAPMLAAGMSKLTGRTIPSAYFLTEIWLCAIAIFVTAWLLHRLGGWWALGLLPLGLGLNWFPPPSALYPAESARAFFFLLVGILAARWDDAARGRSAGGLRDAASSQRISARLGGWWRSFRPMVWRCVRIEHGE